MYLLSLFFFSFSRSMPTCSYRERDITFRVVHLEQHKTFHVDYHNRKPIFAVFFCFSAKNVLHEILLLKVLGSFKEAKHRNCLGTNVKRTCRGIYSAKKILSRKLTNFPLFLSPKGSLKKSLERSLSQVCMYPRPCSIEP